MLELSSAKIINVKYLLCDNLLHIHNIYSNQLRLCFRYRKQNQ